MNQRTLQSVPVIQSFRVEVNFLYKTFQLDRQRQQQQQQQSKDWLSIFEWQWLDTNSKVDTARDIFLFNPPLTKSQPHPTPNPRFGQN